MKKKMLCDFKASAINVANGVTRIVLRCYSGQVDTQKEMVHTTLKDVTRYRRTGKVYENTYKLKGELTDQQINDFLMLEVKKVATENGLTPIPEQNA